MALWSSHRQAGIGVITGRGAGARRQVSGLSGSKHATYGYGKSRRHWKTEPAGEERALIEESKSGPSWSLLAPRS